MTDAHRRAALAERAARAGGVVAREAFRGEFGVETKGDAYDLVTEADLDSQRQVVTTIHSEFPNDPVIAEEDDDVAPGGLGLATDSEIELAEAVPDSGDAWVVDPIDGTANFARGIRVWTTSVAAVVDGEAVGSATYLPAVQDVYTAGPDSATCNGESLSVSDRTDTAAWAVSVLGIYGAGTGDEMSGLARSVVEEFGDLRRFGSMQATFAFVAAGGLDAAIMPHPPNPWDAIAGAHLVESAGGTVTDIEGEDWDKDSDSLVASNGQAHDRLLEVAQSALV